MSLATPSDSQKPIQAEDSTQDAFAPLDALLARHFYKPDLQAVHISLGCLKSHYFPGDPVWLMYVAPPGAGKTTMALIGAAGLGQTELISDLSENTFLSGFYGKVQAGMLEKLGTPQKKGKGKIVVEGNGILLVKDFTTVLEMRPEKRGVILSQLREIHDGTFRRDFGTGETKIWHGKLTVVAAVTPAIDRYMSVANILGERFLQVRVPRPDSEEAGLLAIRQQGQEGAIRNAIQGAVIRLFANSLAEPPGLTEQQEQRIVCLAEVVAVARTYVGHDSCGAVNFVPQPEANTRLSKSIAAIARGVAALRGHVVVTEGDLQDALRTGLESMAEARGLMLLAAASGRRLSTYELHPRVQTRAIEDLVALGVFKPLAGEAYERTVLPEVGGRMAKLLAIAGVKTGPESWANNGSRISSNLGLQESVCR